MKHHTVLVLADPTDLALGMLEALPEDTGVAVGRAPEAFERAAEEADVILHWSAPPELLRQVLRIAPRVRWVHSRVAGVDRILSPELAGHPAVLTCGRGVFSPALAEFALGAILFFAKDFRRVLRNRAEGRWEPFDMALAAGATLGIVGFGDIGREVAARARCLGMRVLALRRHPERSASDPAADEALPPARRLELMERSDYVVCALPLTPDTRGLIGERDFAAMKPTAVLINIGRGPVVDETALVRALAGGRIAGAALDVFEHEPLPPSHPLWRLENVLLSPHCADHTPDWLERAMRAFLENFERFRRGEPLRGAVDKQRGY